MRNATCLCGANVTALLSCTHLFTDAASYAAANCSGVDALAQPSWDAQGNVSYTVSPAGAIPAAVCDAAAANLTAHLAAYNSTVISMLANQRLGDLRTTGKFAQRANVAAALRSFLAATYPELVGAIFVAPRGADASDVAGATFETLAALFVEGRQFLLTGAPANLALYRRRLTGDPGITFAELAARARARVAEIAAQQANIAALPVAGPAGQTLTVAQVVAAFTAAGANTTWLPAAPSLAAPLALDYNLATWGGNTTAYLGCNLELSGPEFLGTCTPIPVSCKPTPSVSAPYACTRLADNSSVAGTIANATYRRECELPCDAQQDCDTLCECWGGCSTGTQYCTCPACQALHPDAAADSHFFTIQGAAASSGAASASIIAATTSGASGRRLQQAAGDVSAQLAAVLAQVASLQAAQGGVAGQLSSLQDQVDRANLLAEARAASTTLQDLISAGRRDIQAGQASLEGKLDTLLQRQQAAIDAMQAANAQLAALQVLSERQADALAALDAATNDRLTAISVATQQGVINLYQALAVWKLARRERALASKLAKLAGSPCSYEPVSIAFSVDNSNSAEAEAARERSLGLNNRVLAGLLLHTWRTADEACPASRFSAVQSRCTAAAPDTSPYGVDSVFKLGALNFNADLYDPNGAMMQAIYNCSELPRPSFNVREPATRLVTNPEPFCVELFNPRSVPYAFWHLPLDGLPPGFPVLLDINLSQGGAQGWLSWLQEGLLLDAHTRGLSAHLVKYNSQLRVFSAVEVEFDFQAGGAIRVASSIYTLSLELYTPTAANLARYAFEVLLAAAIVGLNALQLWEAAAAGLTAKGRRSGGLRAYLSRGSTWLCAANNALLLAGVGLWWSFANQHARAFSMELRYPVYASLEPAAYFLKLADKGAGLTDVWAAMQQLQAAIATLNWYYAVNGVSILLLIARLLRAMDFQPRLGVVTRALALAGPDLLHFAAVAGAVFAAYACMGFLIFGNSLAQFASLGCSVNTCFEMLLGEFADVNADLRALGGLQAAAGVLFFASFMILCFLILLNFLLAIIVDAFSVVKEATHERTGIHVEPSRLLADKWRWLAGLWSRRYVGPARLDALMRAWAGVEEEEAAVAAAAAAAAAAAQHGGSAAPDADQGEGRVLQVAGEALDGDSLAQVLLAVLSSQHDQDGGDDDDPKQQNQQQQHRQLGGGALGGLVALQGAGSGGAGAGVNMGEVEAAAAFIVRRYGKSARRVAEQALQELGPGGRELEDERTSLAAALERLAGAQRELAEAQRTLMLGQRQLSEQQAALLQRGGGLGGGGGGGDWAR